MHVGEHQPVADEARPIADHDAELAHALRESQGRHQHVEAGARSAHDLQQPHPRRRAEEVEAHDRRQPRRRRGDRVDVERGRVGGEDAPGLRYRVDLAEDPQLEGEILEHRFDHQVGLGGARGKVAGAVLMDAGQPLGDGVGRETAAGDRRVVVPPDRRLRRQPGSRQSSRSGSPRGRRSRRPSRSPTPSCPRRRSRPCGSRPA